MGCYTLDQVAAEGQDSFTNAVEDSLDDIGIGEVTRGEFEYLGEKVEWVRQKVLDLEWLHDKRLDAIEDFLEGFEGFVKYVASSSPPEWVPYPPYEGD